MDSTLSGRFLRGLAASGRNPAVAVGDRTVGYGELHERALSWARSLHSATGGPPRAVGVLAGKSVEGYIAVLATLHAGATVVPMNPAFPVARNRAVLRAAGVDAVIADEAGAAVLTDLLDGCPDVAVLVPSTRECDGPGLAEPCPADPSDPAYLLFTSGSTGRPKGVRISHGNLAHYFEVIGERYRFGPEDRFSQTFDLTFDCAMFDLFAAWQAGAGVVAVPPDTYLALPDFLARQEISVWFSTPSAIAMVRWTGALRPASMPGLRWSLFAGEALQLADAAEWQLAAPGSTLENIYGPTELTITISAHRFDAERSATLSVNGVVPIGTVHSGHDWLLLGDDGEPVSDEGELCVAGPQRTPGYLDPVDEDGRFLAREGIRYYRTGDRARLLDSGDLGYLGRADSQVQIGGVRVELAEVEYHVRGCEGVDSAVAVEADGQLVVFYTGVKLPPIQLASRLREVLPEAVVPRRYRHLDSLPLNANRKIDRANLRSSAVADR